MTDLDVSDASILGERGLRYKRNILAASLIATVLYWTDAPLGQVNLFGVGLSNVKDQEAAAWTVFLAILTYQWILLTYYGWRDWRVWQQRIRETFSFSPWNMAFWINKGAVVWEHGAPRKEVISIDKEPLHGIAWRAENLGGGEILESSTGHSYRENIRWRLFAFLTIEFGLPFLWGLGCLCIAMSKIFDWESALGT